MLRCISKSTPNGAMEYIDYSLSVAKPHGSVSGSIDDLNATIGLFGIQHFC